MTLLTLIMPDSGIREIGAVLRVSDTFHRSLQIDARGMLALAAFCLAVAGVTTHGQIAGRLSASELDEAIQRGIAGDVAPYPMYPVGGGLAEKWLAAGARAPALVYTPFVRVALHAKAAYEDGTRLTREEVPSAVFDPVVYVGFTYRACCGEIEERYRDGLLAILAVFDSAAFRNAATAGRAMRDPRAQPLWTHAGTAALQALGIEPPTHIEAVSAFSADVFTGAKEFRLTRFAPASASGVSVFVAPVPSDVPRWR